MSVVLVITALVGCCSAVIFLELQTRENPECGNLVTFASFLFISVEGFVNTTKFGTVKPKVPLKEWITLVVIHFIVSVTSNWAHAYKISMPLYMIFKSGSLVASLLTGMYVLGKRHTKSKYLSVILVTIGIFICTLASGKEVSKDQGASSLSDWFIGIFLLTASLILSARMGVYQEQIYTKWGKHHKEALFYTHALPLPGFLLLGSNIVKHFKTALKSKPISLIQVGSLFKLELPCMIFYLIGNFVSQFICASSIFKMSSKYSSLTITLVLTLRKFLSIMISVWMFDNTFTVQHWIGTVLVFSGTLLFSDVHKQILPTKTKTS